MIGAIVGLVLGLAIVSQCAGVVSLVAVGLQRKLGLTVNWSIAVAFAILIAPFPIIGACGLVVTS